MIKVNDLKEKKVAAPAVGKAVGTHLKLAREYDLININNIKVWDPMTLPEHFSMAIYSRRRSGKTHIMKDFLHKIKDRFDIVYLFSLTANLQAVYDFVPKGNIIDGYDQVILDKIVSARKLRVLQEISKGNIKLKGVPNMLFLFDDVITDGIRHSQKFIELYSCGRHERVSTVCISQRITAIPPIVRDNTDCIISFFLHSESERKMLSELYLSVEHRRVGEQLFKEITSVEYTACIMALHLKSIKYEGYVFKYKAPETCRKFKLGRDDIENNYGQAINNYIEEDLNIRIRLE